MVQSDPLWGSGPSPWLGQSIVAVRACRPGWLNSTPEKHIEDERRLPMDVHHERFFSLSPGVATMRFRPKGADRPHGGRTAYCP
jgi:hypothetical protein